jgi:hypothetical protein
MIILEEARLTLIIIEHDAALYEDATGMFELVSQEMGEAARRLCCFH